jgi:hypothetical protein
MHAIERRDATAPPATIGYLAEVERLLDHWFRLTGCPSADPTLLRACLVHLAALPPSREWRGYSRLCADGSPVELCETVGRHPHGPAYTCDPGPYDAPSVERLATAVRLGEDLLAGVPGGPRLVRTVRERLFPERIAPGLFSLWLGVDHPAQSGAREVRVKIYANLNWRTTDDARSRMLDTFAALGAPAGGAACQLFAVLATRGYPKMLALTVAPSGDYTAKVYYRLQRVDLELFALLAARSALDSAPFALYAERLLRSGPVWSDLNAGVGVVLDTGGEVGGLALYHYVRTYFRDDDQLRQRVLEAAPIFGWDVSVYRATSRLLSAGPGTRLRSLLGFGVTTTYETSLRLYSRADCSAN